MQRKTDQLKQQLAIGLSLVLLAAFLLYYLYSAFLTEQARLRKEVHYLFTNAFRTAESEMLDQMIFELKGVSWLKKHNAATIDIRNHETEMFLMDSIHSPDSQMSKTLIFASKSPEEIRSQDVQVRIQLRSDSIVTDTCKGLFQHGKSFHFETVEKIFKDNLDKSNLSIKYKIQRDSATEKTSEENHYKDVFTQETYSINTDDNHWYVLRGIIPEILFSIILYFVVILAFVSIIRALRKQQELYDMKQDFMRNMTHELKTPIATIGVALEAIQNFNNGSNPELRAEYCRIAEEENHKLNALVDKVLQITQHMDSTNSQSIKTNLKQITEEVLDSFKYRADQKGVHLFMSCTEDSWDLMLDPQNYVMILHNLLDNALKYNKSPKPEIRVSLTRSHSYAILEVSDNGTPIPEEQQKRVFEKFYRIAQGDVHDEKGHGLGLYIVAQLASSLRGSIQLLNSENGNVFKLNFPVQSAI